MSSGATSDVPYFKRSDHVVPKGNEIGEAVVMENPAKVTFPKYAKKLAKQAAKLNKVPTGRMFTRVLAKLLIEENVLLLAPTLSNNPDGFEVRTAGRETWALLYEFMAYHNMLVEEGFRQVVPVQLRENTEIGAALALSLDNAKLEAVKRRKKQA